MYMASLELGQASVQNIAKKAGINRATTYVILKSLLEKGLVSTYEEGKKTNFVASHPQSLVGIFELQKQQVQERENYLKSFLTELVTLYNSREDKPVIRFFEGKAGVLNCVEEFMYDWEEGEDENLKIFYSKDHIDSVFTQKEKERFHEARVKRNVKSEVIYNYTKGELSTSADGERYKVDEKEYPFTCDIGIHGDTVRITQLGKRTSAVLIKDKDIANTLKSLFKLAWERVKEINK